MSPETPAAADTPDADGPSRGPRRSLSREIADAIAGLTRESTGRGPVRVRTIIDGDAVIVLLHDSFTRAEQTLLDHGRGSEVLAFRRAFQDVMRPAYSEAVSRITGRGVSMFMSTNHADPDQAAEIFMLDGPVEG